MNKELNTELKEDIEPKIQKKKGRITRDCQSNTSIIKSKN